MAVIRDEPEEEEPLTFKSSWDIEKIDLWLRKLFPEVFEWLDIRYPLERLDEFHWHILAKEHQKLSVFKKISNVPIDGKDLEKLKGPAAQRWNGYKLWFGKFLNQSTCRLMTHQCRFFPPVSSHIIPDKVSKDWKAAIDTEKRGKSRPSTDDNEGSSFDRTLRKSASLFWPSSESPCSPESKLMRHLFATN